MYFWGWWPETHKKQSKKRVLDAFFAGVQTYIFYILVAVTALVSCNHLQYQMSPLLPKQQWAPTMTHHEEEVDHSNTDWTQYTYRDYGSLLVHNLDILVAWKITIKYKCVKSARCKMSSVPFRQHLSMEVHLSKSMVSDTVYIYSPQTLLRCEALHLFCYRCLWYSTCLYKI